MSQIKLNNRVYNLENAQLKLQDDLPIWEKEIFSFLVEWFSESENITVHTSGSTGAPKLIHRKKKTLQNSALMTGEFFNFQKNQTALLCLPAKFIAGKMMLVRAIVWQLDLFYIEPKIELLIPDMAFQFCAMTPQQVQSNLNNLAKINFLIIGGAPISSNLESQIASLNTSCYATFGMTETVSHIALREINTQNNLLYQALPGVTLITNSKGCLVINAPHLIAHPIVTTDLVKLTSNNSFEWLGRVDNVINSGGVKIHPEILEKKISDIISNPFIITSIPSSKWGEEVIMVIESKFKSDTELQKLLIKRLTKAELPKSIYYTESFSRTENGKINRTKTTELALKNG